MKLINNDCLIAMKEIPDGSIDAVICDPPYGTTACKWDTCIPFEPMWEQLKRVTKKNGAIVLFGSQPFTSALVMSNPKMFKYEWVWEKHQGTNPMMAKKAPLKSHENISVFYEKQPTYNPQMEEGTPYSGFSSSKIQSEVYGGGKSIHRENITGERYPKTILRFTKDKGKRTHPTQKPVALGRYLVRTYTNEGDTVLDFTAGSGSFGVAAILEKRHFIGIELDEKYFAIAQERIRSEVSGGSYS